MGPQALFSALQVPEDVSLISESSKVESNNWDVNPTNENIFSQPSGLVGLVPVEVEVVGLLVGVELMPVVVVA